MGSRDDFKLALLDFATSMPVAGAGTQVATVQVCVCSSRRSAMLGLLLVMLTAVVRSGLRLGVVRFSVCRHGYAVAAGGPRGGPCLWSGWPEALLGGTGVDSLT